MSDNFKGDLDPQIANLIGLTPEEIPDFETLSGEQDSNNPLLSNKTSLKIISNVEAPAVPYFDDINFYKKAMNNEGIEAKKMLELLAKFLNASIPGDKSIFRQRVIPAYWDLLASMACRITEELPVFKTLLMRYGLVSTAFISPEQRTMFSHVPLENNTGEPLYYMDEWIKRVALGLENPSATDEVKVVNKDTVQKTQEKLEKTKGQRDSEIAFANSKIMERDSLELLLRETIQGICDHSMAESIDGLRGGYSEAQKKLFLKTGDIMRQLTTINKDIVHSFATLHNLDKSLETLEKRSDDMDSSTVDNTVITGELNTLRQMSKMNVGRKGNHFPIIMRNYLRANIKELGTRENINNEMAFVESIDPGVFLRTFKNQTNRIIPNVIILPNFGDLGVCWEPFERRNKASSRGRIAIPMYPKDLRMAVVAALGDLRWQVAKEKAQHYWMEEGITGKYYQWFSDRRRKGDVRASFMEDYVLWITKESTGLQKLDREVRGIFWRNIPFPQAIKDDLKNRGFVYSELFKKDINRSMSDGY